ncbi:hypothetical protein AURDEDRAFT_171314 [Auricularia subglabra TFB-10046 SS5]|nr:hypothetical protein AURDEDRAFT_171314 [Auricularia subglabra TFB-10046 SS5]
MRQSARASGSSRTLILSAHARSFLSGPLLSSITSLTLDELDLYPESFPLDSPLAPALEHLRIRISEDCDVSGPLFEPVSESGGDLRASKDVPGESWRFDALRQLDLAYAPWWMNLEDEVPRSPSVTCGDLLKVLNRLCAPHSVSLGLENIKLIESAGSEDHTALGARVSGLILCSMYEPGKIEEEWPIWRVYEDK